MTGAMLVCPEPPAAQAGGAILAQGGNAADAAIAAAFAQGVANPLLCGLSGTAILLHRAPDGRTTVLNGECATGSGPVPPAWIATLGGRAELIGRYIVGDDDNQIGPPSVMVPGFVACCWALFQRFGSGRIGWAALLEPAIRLAADGFPVYPYIAATWALDGDGQAAARPGYPTLRAKLMRDPAAAAIYMKDGMAAYAAGDVLRQPLYARTLDQLARAGGDDFQTGAIGTAMAADLARRGSLVTPADVATYRVVDQAARAMRYRDHDIVTTPPPSPGVQILEMLAICAALGVGPRDAPDTIDTILQAMRAGFADNRDIKAVQLADADAWSARMLDPARSAAWARRIAAGERVAGAAERPGTGTTHLVVRDDDGAAISFTHSIGSVAGSGAVTPELGFLHNNFLGHFDPRPGRPMSILPGRRIGSGAPTMACRDGRLRLMLGAPGGSRIISAIFQVLLHVLDHGMPVDAAVAALRVHSEEGNLVHLEPGWPTALAAALAARGDQLRENRYQARVQAIAIADDGTPLAGADPRGGAVARA
jgi:gamma-glutamyltranspeptidase/glutathione hydrolase